MPDCVIFCIDDSRTADVRQRSTDRDQQRTYSSCCLVGHPSADYRQSEFQIFTVTQTVCGSCCALHVPRAEWAERPKPSAVLPLQPFDLSPV